MKRDFNDPHYKEFRRKVLRRDKAKCQYPNCKRRGRGMHVHHILPHSQYSSLRLEPSNGICLCPEHHKLVTDYELIWAGYFNECVTRNEKAQKRPRKPK